jgi:CBS domain containing-hemolysin-like protein
MPEYGNYTYRFLLITLIIGVNGFFAASEVALLSSRRSRLKAMAEEGVAGVQPALSLLANPERLLSVIQVGVTLASLVLGWVGEDTFYSVLTAVLSPIVTPATQAFLHAASIVLAFLLMTFAHVVLGEVVPKNLAIEKAERLAVIVAPVLLVFFRVMEPFVYILERSSTIISRAVGLRGDTHAGSHSPEEIKYIVSASAKEGQLLPFEAQAVRQLIEIRECSVREIMVPRNQIVSVSVNATLDYVLRLMNEHLYSRLAVYDGSPERIVGFVHLKDLLQVWMERRAAAETRRQVAPFRLERLMRKPLVLPETKPLHELIGEFRAAHAHVALVVDEFGTITGMVTIEDVLEQVFGEIEDEHDIRRPHTVPGAPVVDVEGTIPIRDLCSQYGIELTGDAGFQTLAGFLLARLGFIPKGGESLVYEGRRFTITHVERNRIVTVRIEKLVEA